MAGFLYFRANNQATLTPAVIEQLGLSYAFDGGVESRACNANNEFKVQGALFAEPDRYSKRLGYFADRQTWLQQPLDCTPENETVYVGYWNDDVPAPGDLSRFPLLDGAYVRLLDENEWLIPIVRRYDRKKEELVCMLPCKLAYNGDGRIGRGAVVPKYQDLWDKVAAIAEREFENSEQDEKAILDCVEALLQANYRVSLAEMILLEALADDDSLLSIVMVASHYHEFVDRVEEVAKKKSAG